jgi:hypothetical protein
VPPPAAAAPPIPPAAEPPLLASGVPPPAPPLLAVTSSLVAHAPSASAISAIPHDPDLIHERVAREPRAQQSGWPPVWACGPGMLTSRRGDREMATGIEDLYARFAELWANSHPLRSAPELEAALRASEKSYATADDAWLLSLDRAWVYHEAEDPFEDEQENRAYRRELRELLA